VRTIREVKVWPSIGLATTSIVFLLLVAFLSLSATGLAMTADGFITQIDSPLSFEVSGLHVLLSGRTKCALRIVAASDTSFDPSSRWDAPHTRLFSPQSDFNRALIRPCNLLQPTVGSAVTLVGNVQADTQTLAAISFTLISVQRSIDLVGTASIEESIERTYTSQGTNGELWLDGYPITITRRSSVLPAPKGTSLSPVLKKNGAFKIKWGDINSLASPTVVTRGVYIAPSETAWIHYHAIQAADGNIMAVDMRFWNNTVGRRQEAYIRQFAPQIKLPDYAKQTPGHVMLGKENATIVSSPAVQAWISKIGRSLVPRYQASLNDDDPTKIRFRFYIVRPVSVVNARDFQIIDGTNCRAVLGGFSYLNPKRHSLLKGILSTQDGVVLVPENVLSSLNNMSELSALLSYGITSIVQNQPFQLWSVTTYAPGVKLRDMSHNDLNLCAFLTRQNEQVLRIGIRQMYLAGYDIREAPYAWAVAQGKPVANPVIDSKHPDKEIPWYAAYAFNYISQYYQNVDYSKLKRGRAEYQEFLQELYKADPSLKHPAAQK